MGDWLKINKDQNGFLKDGKPFFYLADTVWSAFTNVKEDEWEYYLNLRKAQGFNTLQINTMPQWDRCMADDGIYPFPSKDGLLFEFRDWNQKYYEKAKRLCQMAVERDFQLALVILWLNHVPGTWAGRVATSNEMPREFVQKYTEKIIEEFDQFHPIYIISGDTDIDTQEALDHYKIALDTACKKSPDSLKCFHLKRGYSFIPQEFLNKIDFYMYQSGHNKNEQDITYKMPEIFKEKYPQKPIINSEPCYEQMGSGKNINEKFGVRDVRTAAWSSILSGASAGITYGAHGIWNWQKGNKPATPIVKQGFCLPQPWQAAVHFPGAWEYGWIHNFLKSEKIDSLISVNHLLKDADADIRMSKTKEGRYLIYLPYSSNLRISKKLQGYKGRIIEMESKRIAKADICVLNDTEETLLKVFPFQSDVLVILEK